MREKRARGKRPPVSPYKRQVVEETPSSPDSPTIKMKEESKPNVKPKLGNLVTNSVTTTSNPQVSIIPPGPISDKATARDSSEKGKRSGEETVAAAPARNTIKPTSTIKATSEFSFGEGRKSGGDSIAVAPPRGIFNAPGLVSNKATSGIFLGPSLGKGIKREAEETAVATPVSQKSIIKALGLTANKAVTGLSSAFKGIKREAEEKPFAPAFKKVRFDTTRTIDAAPREGKFGLSFNMSAGFPAFKAMWQQLDLPVVPHAQMVEVHDAMTKVFIQTINDHRAKNPMESLELNPSARVDPDGVVTVHQDRDRMETSKTYDILQATIHAWIRDIIEGVDKYADNAIGRLSKANFIKDMQDYEVSNTIDLVDGLDSKYRSVCKAGRPSLGKLFSLPEISQGNGNCQGILGYLGQDEKGVTHLLVKKSKNMFNSISTPGYLKGTILEKAHIQHAFVIARYPDEQVWKIGEQLHRSLLNAWSTDILRAKPFSGDESEVDRLFNDIWLITIRACYRHDFWGSRVGHREWEGVSSSLPFFDMADKKCWILVELPDVIEYSKEDKIIFRKDGTLEKAWLDKVPDGVFEDRCASPTIE